MEERHNMMAKFLTRLASEGISVDEVPQVGQENLKYRFGKEERGALPGMINYVKAIDREGTKFHIALFDMDMPLITATLTNKAKRLRRLSQLPPVVFASADDQSRIGPDYISGT